MHTVQVAPALAGTGCSCLQAAGTHAILQPTAAFMHPLLLLPPKLLMASCRQSLHACERQSVVDLVSECHVGTACMLLSVYL